MSTFVGKNINNTFKSILNIGVADNSIIPVTELVNITDGDNTASSLSIGAEGNGIHVCGGIEATSGLTGTSLAVTGAVTGNTVCSTTSINGATLGVSGDTCIGGTTTVTGTIRGCGDIIAYYSSDNRLKDNLETICDTQSIIKGLTGYSFDWNEKTDREGRDLGIMAQDAKEVLPIIVKERDDGILAVDYIKLIPVLIEEVKRLGKEVDELKAR